MKDYTQAAKKRSLVEWIIKLLEQKDKEMSELRKTNLFLLKDYTQAAKKRSLEVYPILLASGDKEANELNNYGREGFMEGVEWIIKLLEQKDKDIEKLSAFKSYVHNRLDEAGVEKEPNGEHSKHGCRIGDRLDIVLEKQNEVNELVEGLLKVYNSGNEGIDHVAAANYNHRKHEAKENLRKEYKQALSKHNKK